MKGDEQVIQFLIKGMTHEIGVSLGYMRDHAVLDNKHYGKLAGWIEATAIEEMKHWHMLAERALQLDYMPSIQADPFPEGGQAERIILNEADFERAVIKLYNEAVACCAECGDNASRELFEAILKDEVKHLEYLEAQILQISELGYANWLQAQI